ncbi:MAG: hypothetical protein HYZ42_04180 [Bacteroidetes bacterium]|nr:hypothetical protein [Bacteroidota bacterium]
MRKINCDFCENKSYPLNDTIRIDSKTYCSSCFEVHFPNQKDLENKIIEKDLDPTICTNCKKDFEEVEIKKIASYPICDECEIGINERIFPAWVKAFFAAIVIIVVGAFFWNWKYYQAYNEIKDANFYFQQGEFNNASTLMQEVSKKVPEVEDLKIIAAYFHGMELLNKDKCSESLVEFSKCYDRLPPDYNLSYFINSAKIGIAFDSKDYEGFLALTKENLNIDSTIPISLASVASAYACVYADKGNEIAKQNAIDYLNRAKELNDSSKDMQEYYNMIEYRIDSKKIIKRELFTKLFPNGWTKN